MRLNLLLSISLLLSVSTTWANEISGAWAYNEKRFLPPKVGYSKKLSYLGHRNAEYHDFDQLETLVGAEVKLLVDIKATNVFINLDGFFQSEVPKYKTLPSDNCNFFELQSAIAYAEPDSEYELAAGTKFTISERPIIVYYPSHSGAYLKIKLVEATWWSSSEPRGIYATCRINLKTYPVENLPQSVQELIGDGLELSVPSED